MQGFKDFVLKGNLVELAVAFIMASSFAARGHRRSRTC